MILKSHGHDVRIANLTVGQMLGNERGIGSGVFVSEKSTGGLPAFSRAVGIAAEAVAKRDCGVFRGADADKKRVTTTWQARLFGGTPNDRQSWFDLWEETEASMTATNNAIWLKVADKLGRVDSVFFVPKHRVEARWNRELSRAEYRVKNEDGSGWSDWLDGSVVLHFRIGHLQPGSIMAPTPVEVFREALKAALAKSKYESNHYDQGLMKSLAVTFPGDVKPEQARRFRELLQSEHGGVPNSAGVRVFGGGATVTEVGISLADAQFIESMNFDVEQIARITRVWASLIGGNGGTGSTRQMITPEHEEDRWYRYGLEPRLTRYEKRVLADPSFFGAGSRDYLEFLSSAVRADAATESRMLVSEVQCGITLADEARAIKGRPPLPNGLGQIPQITPVGGAPNDAAGQVQEATRQLLEREIDLAIERILATR